MISEVNSNKSAVQAQLSTAQAQSKQAASAETQAETANPTDTVDLGTSQSIPVTYSKTSTRKSAVDVTALKSAAEQKYANLRGLVEQLLKKQNESSKKTVSSWSTSQDTVNPAQQAISEDGDFGVKAVSDRIVKFAVAVSGGDKAKYEELKSAIDKGFQQAAKSLGGELPGISQQTYKEVMRKLDDWKNGDDETA